MSNITNINKVSGSKYDIYNKFLTLAEHYFGTNTDYLRSGFMSYVTECMASVMRDSAIHKSMLYNESFLNTAIMPKSIYNWAKMFNIEVSKAKPAFTDIMMTINLNDLENMYTKKTGNNSEFAKFGKDVTDRGTNNIFVIDRNNPFIVGNYYFALERSILIYRTGEGDNWVVQYCTTETPETTTFGDMDEKFLKTVITGNADNRYLSFIVRVWQYKTTTIQKQITSSSFADTKIHTFEFTDQLAGLRIQYSKNNLTESIPLIFADSINNTNEKYAYYSIIDDNKVQIKFINGVFLPTVGGTIIVDLFTTTGSAGNYSFSSDLTFTLNDEDYRSLAITTTFVDYQSYGGVDTPKLSQIKSNIISDISARNVIVTETDLNNYFFKLASLLESINDGKVQFIKKRDDIIKRTFNAYLLLRTGLNPNNDVVSSSGYRSSVIPTNTVDVTFPITENISKPFGSLVKEKKSSTTSVVEYHYIPEQFQSSTDDDYYVIPFYMRILLNPIKKVKYIYNVADDSTSLKYTSITSTASNYNMTPSSVDIKRGMDGTMVEDKYRFNFVFASNFYMDKSTASFNELKFKFYTSESTSTAIDLLSSGIGTNVEWDITSEQEANSDIYKTTISVNLKVSNQEFKFDDLTDYGTHSHLAYNNHGLPENVDVGLIVSLLQGGSNLSYEVKSDRKLGVFRSLDDLMSSDILVNTQTIVTEDEDDGTTTSTDYIKSITLKEVPVVHSSFFNTHINQTKFIQQLFTYIDLLKSHMNVLETNTFFNIKFMNTYGYSQKYSTSRTNINLEFTIYLKTSDLNSVILENEIRDYIRVIVDKYNNDSTLSVSTIITLVTAAYHQYIDHIVFEGLNGTFSQYIRPIDISENRFYVPEYFSLDAQKLTNSIKFKNV